MVDDNLQEYSPTHDTSRNQGSPESVSGNSSLQSVGTAVISAIAARSDTDPMELDPLYSVVNPDALDALFQPGTVGHVSFPYNGYEVVVHSDEEIDVSKADE